MLNIEESIKYLYWWKIIFRKDEKLFRETVVFVHIGIERPICVLWIMCIDDYVYWCVCIIYLSGYFNSSMIALKSTLIMRGLYAFNFYGFYDCIKKYLYFDRKRLLHLIFLAIIWQHVNNVKKYLIKKMFCFNLKFFKICNIFF